jgi:uncharacterized sulfatase
LPLKDAYDGKPPQGHALGSDRLGHGPIEWADRSTITGRYVDRALAFIDDPANAGKPLFINVWPDDVHSPFFPPKGKRGNGKKRRLYYNVLEAMDLQLAPLLDRVRSDPRLRDNTIILLASDNGPEPGAGSAGPLRGSKGGRWEGGIRSPQIVLSPARNDAPKAGSINETSMLSSVDLMVSLHALSGAKPPADYLPDGENVLAALLGKSSASRSKPLFWRRPPDRPGTPENPRPDLAVRDANWKLVCDLDGAHAQLFDLATDVGEEHDVSATHKQITNRLKKAVLEWNATLPTDATSRKP